MRDWNALVRERLSGRGLTDVQQDEVVAELAAHLEDLYEHERSLGATENGAISRALDEVADWRRLSRNISRSKNEEEQMNHRTGVHSGLQQLPEDRKLSPCGCSGL